MLTLCAETVASVDGGDTVMDMFVTALTVCGAVTSLPLPAPGFPVAHLHGIAGFPSACGSWYSPRRSIAINVREFATGLSRIVK
jgi:hypothetical protein